MSRELRELLSGEGLDDLYELFVTEEIEASMVPDLSDDDLKELGLKLGQRKKFAAAFRQDKASSITSAQMPAERRQLTVATTTHTRTAINPAQRSAVVEIQACLLTPSMIFDCQPCAGL